MSLSSETGNLDDFIAETKHYLNVSRLHFVSFYSPDLKSKSVEFRSQLFLLTSEQIKELRPFFRHLELIHDLISSYCCLPLETNLNLYQDFVKNYCVPFELELYNKVQSLLSQKDLFDEQPRIDACLQAAGVAVRPTLANR